MTEIRAIPSSTNAHRYTLRAAVTIQDDFWSVQHYKKRFQSMNRPSHYTNAYMVFNVWDPYIAEEYRGGVSPPKEII